MATQKLVEAHTAILALRKLRTAVPAQQCNVARWISAIQRDCGFRVTGR